MRYDICSACMWFQPRLLTEEYSIPKSCTCPSLNDVFSPDVGGFPLGIDMIQCDYFHQYPWSYGDVVIRSKDGTKNVSYVLTQPRKFKLVRVPKLYDNSQNIKLINLEKNG